MASWLLSPLNTLSNEQRTSRGLFVFLIAKDAQEKDAKAILKRTEHLLLEKGYNLQRADIDLRDVLQNWLLRRARRSYAKKYPSKKIKKVRPEPKQKEKSKDRRYLALRKDEMVYDPLRLEGVHEHRGLL